MIYIYDILLNFSDELLYEFYEWNNNDKIDNMKKIKLAKIDKKVFDDFINKKIKVDTNFLTQIYNTCEVYEVKGCSILNYCVLLTDGNRVVGIEFDKNGYIMCMSKMLLDEEDEVLELTNNLEIININYEIKDNIKNNRLFTRKELNIKKYICIEALSAYKNKNYNKLDFMYMELFDDNSINEKEKYNKIINSMQEDISNNHFNLYKMLKLVHKKKQV